MTQDQLKPQTRDVDGCSASQRLFTLHRVTGFE